jgi:hypothetical protein
VTTKAFKRDRYVYALEERHGTIIYIGVGKGRRYHAHLSQARRGIIGTSNKAKGEYLILCLETGVELEVYKIAENLTIDEACRLEAEIIDLLGRRDLGEGPLLNANDGGGGVRNAAPSTRAKMSEAARKRMSSPEWRAALIEAARTPEARAKISEAARKRWPEHGAKMAAANSTAEVRAKQRYLARNRSPEHNANISKRLKGRKLAPVHAANIQAAKLTPERRAAQAELARKLMESPERRAAQSDLARRLMTSAAHRERMAKGNSTPEARAKMSEAARNRSPEHREKLAEARRLQFSSPESRAQLSERARAWWAARKRRIAITV